jgi:hypothetical protein
VFASAVDEGVVDKTRSASSRRMRTIFCKVSSSYAAEAHTFRCGGGGSFCNSAWGALTVTTFERKEGGGGLCYRLGLKGGRVVLRVEGCR